MRSFSSRARLAVIVDWREYQEEAGSFFRSLGMDAVVEESIKGARSSHDVDVAVRFTAFGVQQLWVVECKLWKEAVDKSQVLVLKGVLDDIGADRGFLLSESSFQSGAVTAARMSRITLTNLADLHLNAEEDLQAARWDELYRRLVRVRDQIHELTVVTDRGKLASGSILHPGVDSEEYFRRIGSASFLDHALERARLGKFPTAYGGDADANEMYVATDMAGLLDGVERELSAIEHWASEQSAKPWPDRPEPATGISEPGGPTVVPTGDAATEMAGRHTCDDAEREEPS
ncbi:MAG: restriction endonuclease [Actinomycetota bacterium]